MLVAQIINLRMACPVHYAFGNIHFRWLSLNFVYRHFAGSSKFALYRRIKDAGTTLVPVNLLSRLQWGGRGGVGTEQDNWHRCIRTGLVSPLPRWSTPLSELLPLMCFHASSSSPWLLLAPSAPETSRHQKRDFVESSLFLHPVLGEHTPQRQLPTSGVVSTLIPSEVAPVGSPASAEAEGGRNTRPEVKIAERAGESASDQRSGMPKHQLRPRLFTGSSGRNGSSLQPQKVQTGLRRSHGVGPRLSGRR